jgi:phosphoribosyl 1,2-cyclic phosphodiesterase
MKVTFWGVRGSIATSGPEFSRFGGNTTCLEVGEGDSRLILDAGTGLRGLGQKLLAEASASGRKVDVRFLFSHLHWDHIQGFPFFGPAFVPGTKLALHGPKDEDGVTTLEGALDRQMTPPHFPVRLSQMAAQKVFHTIACGDALEHEPFKIRTRALSHPQGSLGYRIEANGRSICFATDVEHVDGGEIDEAILDLARDVDLLIYDAQYTPAEYAGGPGPSRKGWGHSTYAGAAKIAKAAGAKRLALFHHDPGHDDATVEAIERGAQGLFYPSFAAREGATVDV